MYLDQLELDRIINDILSKIQANITESVPLRLATREIRGITDNNKQISNAIDISNTDSIQVVDDEGNSNSYYSYNKLREVIKYQFNNNLLNMVNKDFTSRDIVSIRNNIIDYIQRYTNKITDFSESEVTMVFVEILAGITEMANFYLDNQFHESFLKTALQENNIRGLLENYGYQYIPVTASRGSVNFTVPDTLQAVEGQSIAVIPKYTPLKSFISNIPFVTTEDCKFVKGEQTKSCNIVQGTLHSILINRDNIENYRYYLPDVDISMIDVEFKSENNVDIWERVDDAFLELEGGKKFSVHCNSFNRYYLLFAYDYANYIREDTMRISYVTTLGSRGNVPANSITTLTGKEYISLFVDDIDVNKINVYNPLPATGGTEGEDLTLAKAKAMKSIKSMGRYITLQDYEGAFLNQREVLNCYVTDISANDGMVDRPYTVLAYLVLRNNNVGYSEISDANSDFFGVNREALESLIPEIIHYDDSNNPQGIIANVSKNAVAGTFVYALPVDYRHVRFIINISSNKYFPIDGVALENHLRVIYNKGTVGFNASVNYSDILLNIQRFLGHNMFNITINYYDYKLENELTETVIDWKGILSVSGIEYFDINFEVNVEVL